MIVIPVFVLPMVIAVRTTSSDDEQQGMPLWNIVLAVGLLVASALTIIRLLAGLAGVDREAPAIAEGFTDDRLQQQLLTRWLARTRWARNVGGICGLLMWAFGTNANGNIVVFGVTGIALGTMLSETLLVVRRRGPRTASLQARSLSQYIERSDSLQMVIIAACAAVLATFAAAAGHSSAAATALAGVVVLGLARLVQHRVARRARPAANASLTSADDLARKLAIGCGLAQPASYCALALIHQACRQFGEDPNSFVKVLALAALLAALALWWRNRRLGLDWLRSSRSIAPA